MVIASPERGIYSSYNVETYLASTEKQLSHLGGKAEAGAFHTCWVYVLWSLLGAFNYTSQET